MVILAEHKLRKILAQPRRLIRLSHKKRTRKAHVNSKIALNADELRRGEQRSKSLNEE